MDQTTQQETAQETATPRPCYRITTTFSVTVTHHEPELIAPGVARVRSETEAGKPLTLTISGPFTIERVEAFEDLPPSVYADITPPTAEQIERERAEHEGMLTRILNNVAKAVKQGAD